MHPHGAGPQKIELNSVQSIVAVASGKGGVGKSTVAVNLALALKMQGHRIGLLDADIYGPSIPIMLGVPQVNPQTTQFPLDRFGLKLMSMGFLVNPNQAVIWRGPMVDKYLRQFLMAVPWGDLDYMVIDLPPGTGDAQLTLTQALRLSGAVIVTTPQEVSLIDARKGRVGGDTRAAGRQHGEGARTAKRAQRAVEDARRIGGTQREELRAGDQP